MRMLPIIVILSVVQSVSLFSQEYGAPGTVKWRYVTGNSVRSSPAIGKDGNIFFGSDDGNIYAINSEGNVLWRYKMGWIVPSSPAVDNNGTIYIGGGDYYLYAFEPSGKLKWRYKTEDHVYSSPAVSHDGSIYFGSNDNYLYALTPEGKLKWRYQVNDDVDGAIAIGSDGTIYFAAGTYIYALTPSGTLRWRYQTRADATDPAISDDGRIYFGGCDFTLYSVSSEGKLMWKYEWQFRGVGYISSPVIDWKGNLYIMTADNYLCKLTNRGKLKWRYQLCSSNLQLAGGTSIAISTDSIIYAGRYDSFYALNLEGILLWKCEVGREISSTPAISQDGTIFLGVDSFICAIRSNSKGLANTSWPRPRHDNRNTGCVQTQDKNLIRDASVPPSLDFSVSLLENKSIWRGGEKVGFIVTVDNKGKGKGEVDVILSGDDYLLKLFGKGKALGEIEPGKTKSEVFTVNLPTEPPTKEATLYIELKEKIWGESPTKKEVIRVSLLPAEKGIPKPPPEPLLPAPNAFANKRPNAYCLIVGIQDYQQVGRLKYAQKDAEAFKYYCKGVLGIPESNIKTLYDQQATGLPLITAIRDWLGRKKNASMLVFYYSGHGAFNPDNPREDTFGYLVPFDGSPDLGVGTMISTKDIVSYLEESGVDTIIVILDACFSGNPDMGKTPQIAQKAGISPQIVAPPSRKAIVLTSTTSAKPSLEYDEAGYSYFTYYFLQGLKGKADKDPNDGWITIDEAYNYARTNVESTTDGRQIPLKSGSQCHIRLGRYE